MSDRQTSRALLPAPAFEPPLERSESGVPESSRVSDISRVFPPFGVSPARQCPTRADLRAAPAVSTGRTPASAEVDVDAVRRFAERAVRIVLETVDGRRPVAQLVPLADPTVVAAVTTVVRTGAAERRLGPAVPVTLEVAVIGPRAAEVFGSYERGGRRFALAARILRGRRGWRLAVLRLR
ncbi:Rv3235 family protein [Nocardia sp. BMG111209]|uniref:Rv3235 family protein n=1 Tax=Nocardia sp. BMG111209 TaxID=1160137 RepID=UPI0003658B97|nr:Rv3235 family protein [Nocardia sp. BMG111209]